MLAIRVLGMGATALILIIVAGSVAIGEAPSIPPLVDSTAQQVTRDTTKLETVFLLGLRGDVSAALSLLDSLSDTLLTPRQRELKEKYYTRFRRDHETAESRTNDSAVTGLLGIYRTYWRRALLDNASLAQYDSMLARDVLAFLRTHGTANADIPTAEPEQNFTDRVQEFLSGRGMYAATGRTGLFYDLLIHAREIDTNFDVQTPEEHVQVKVVFMDDLVSNGWEEFATFGTYFPGGWATDTALYCARETYDLESENFKVSYLMHEGKHFADYKKFPKLASADLEYRAKLVELSAAQESLYHLLRFFSRNSSSDTRNPHSFANYCVLRDLANSGRAVHPKTDSSWWETAPMPEIHSRAVEVLKRNTAVLMRCGPDTVTSVLR